MKEAIICKTCGRMWDSLDLKRAEKTEKESLNCSQCNGEMKISGVGWVSWECTKCGYNSGLEYCSECRMPKNPGDLRYLK